MEKGELGGQEVVCKQSRDAQEHDMFKERGTPSYPCKSALALKYETPIHCIQEALRSPSCFL